MKKFSKKLKKGFTLVELVVVIAIIAILSAASVATYFGVTESARKSTSKSNAQQVAQLIYVEALSELDDSPINFGTAGLVLKYEKGSEDGKFADDVKFLTSYLHDNGIEIDGTKKSLVETEATPTVKSVSSLTYTESGYSYTIAFANRNYTLTAAN